MAIYELANPKEFSGCKFLGLLSSWDGLLL
jgi:hypothetical protein